MTLPPKPPRDPFGPPLDDEQARGYFRRLRALPHAEQRLFIAKINWHLADPGLEWRLMTWLISALDRPDPDAQRFALKTLDRLPHTRRGRYAHLFAARFPDWDEDLRERVAAAFGPVLGGARKAGKSRPVVAPPAANKPVAPPPPPPTASADDLAKMRDYLMGKR